VAERGLQDRGRDQGFDARLARQERNTILTVPGHGIEHDGLTVRTDPFELLLEVSHEGICLLDSGGRCRGISSAGARLLGYYPQDLSGRPFHAVIHASSGTPAEKCPLCGPALEEFEGRGLLTRRDGTAFEAACTARAIAVGAGLEGRLLVFTKIGGAVEELEPPQRETQVDPEAKLRRAVAELAAEKQRTESVHIFARQLFITPLGDLDGTLIDQFCALTDSRLGLLYKADEPERDLGLAASHGLFRSGVADRIPSDQGSVGAALSARRPVVEDHSNSPLELAGRGIRHILYVPLWEGEEDLAVLILARTVPRPYSRQEQESVAHLAELASVALANTRVVARLERLSQLTRAALDGIVEAIRLVDPEGRELFANASMRNLGPELGLSLRGSLYGSEGVEFANRTTDPEAYMAELHEMQADLERRTRTEWELEESGRLFERYTAPIRDSLGAFIGRVLVLREMTAERRAERLQADLISFASHELRTPLTSMLGFASVLLEQRPESDAEWGLHMETIRSEIVRLLAIVDDLLDSERIVGGGFALARTRFDLNDLIDEQIPKFATASNIHELVHVSPRETLMVEADRDRLAQVLWNLLSNAIKYSPEGGVVRIVSESSGDRVRVSISDSGIGIPEDQQDKVFTKFFRIESAETADIRGLGLGLTLCREIVAAHGGTIGFDSAPGAGAVFWFELPLD